MALDKIRQIVVEINNSKKFEKLSQLLSKLKEEKKRLIESGEEKYISIVPYMSEGFSYIVSNFENFLKVWEESTESPKDETLENGEKLIKVFYEDFSRSKDEEYPETIFGLKYLSNAKKFLTGLEKKIEEERKRRKNGNNSSLDWQIKTLKIRIRNLEEKISDPSISDDLKFQYKYKIRGLKNDLELKEREKAQREEGGFPAKLVLISVGLGAVIILLLVILYLRLSRRNQRY